MKILYAVQGTGNGHVARATEIVPLLKKQAEVDVLISGNQSDLEMPFPVKYRMTGLGFVFGKKGGVDLLATYKKSRLRRFLKEVSDLPVDKYDLVISDFEPVSAWACYLRSRTCIALSHQAAVISGKAPRPKTGDPFGKAILKLYAPANVRYGFHFNRYDDHIFTPVIRQAVREKKTRNLGHYTVYLPSYSDKRIILELSKYTGVKWEIFSKHFTHPISSETIKLLPVSSEAFLESMATAAGVLCGAGFETPAEALYLRKKLLVVPMKNQYEQHCNAAALKEMGVPVLKSLKSKHSAAIAAWIESGPIVDVQYKDETESILDHIMEAHAVDCNLITTHELKADKLTVKKMRGLTLKKILQKLSG